MVMLPVKISLRHRGKVLELDREAETMTLLGPTGEPLGAVPWEAVINFIQGYVKEDQSHRAVRNYPQSSRGEGALLDAGPQTPRQCYL